MELSITRPAGLGVYGQRTWDALDEREKDAVRALVELSRGGR